MIKYICGIDTDFRSIDVGSIVELQESIDINGYCRFRRRKVAE